jgi:hypothetical protein
MYGGVTACLMGQNKMLEMLPEDVETFFSKIKVKGSIRRQSITSLSMLKISIDTP